MKLLFIFLASLAACTTVKHKPSEATETDKIELLREKSDVWQLDFKSLSDPNTGWFSADCDGILWLGEAVAAGHTGQMVLAEGEPGDFSRRARFMGECYPEESRTTTSPDMRQGVMLGAWAKRDVQMLERFAERGRESNWIVGLPMDNPSVIMRPTEIGLLFRMLKALGSDFETNEREKVGLLCAPVVKDYEFHIQTLGILLDGEVSGGISDACMEILKRNVTIDPKDALMQAALGIYTGDFEPALALLLDDAYECPSYVRPIPAYCTVHKAFAAKVILKRFEGK